MAVVSLGRGGAVEVCVVGADQAWRRQLRREDSRRKTSSTRPSRAEFLRCLSCLLRYMQGDIQSHKSSYSQSGKQRKSPRVPPNERFATNTLRASPSPLPPLANQNDERNKRRHREAHKEPRQQRDVREPERLHSISSHVATALRCETLTLARKPNMERIVAAGTSMSTP